MLLTKLYIPNADSNTIHRTALFNKLDLGFKRKLTLISAPAGFGKSTLLGDWIQTQQIPTAWFSIDHNDNDPIDFLSYFILAIQNIKKNFAQSVYDLLKSTTPPSSDSIINLLINETLEIPNDFLVVLDDFHLINNTEIIKTIEHFVEYMPNHIHLVILTRSDPALPIARLRSQHQLIELRSADLSFTTNEISTLFNKRLQIKLSPEQVEMLENKTEGWIAGLQLAALSMAGQNNLSAFIHALKGDNRYIMDYLIEEVLKIQSDDIKDFLLCTSILEQVSAPIGNAILERNDSQLLLEELEKNNMFVFPLDNDRSWYRYHHLFADLLRQRLMLQEQTKIKQLHTRASYWYEQNNMHEQAIEHALKADDYNRAIHLLGISAEEMWKNGLHAALINYGELLPDELIKKNPEYCLYYAWILITGGKLQIAEPFLTSAEKIAKERIKLATSQQLSIHQELLGKIAVAFAYMYSQNEQSEKSFSYCELALNNLIENNDLWLSWMWFSYGLSYFYSGKIEDSETAFNKAFDYGKKTDNIYLISTIVIRMAESEQQLGKYTLAYNRCKKLMRFITEKGYLELTKSEWTYAGIYFIMGITEFSRAQFKLAIDNIKTAYALSKGVKDIYLRVLTLMVYSYVLKELGDSESKNRVNELEEIIRSEEVPSFLKYSSLALRVYLLIEEEQFEEANLIVNEHITHEPVLNFSNEVLYITKARLLIAQYKLDEAETIIDKLYPKLSSGNQVERTIELQLLKIQLHHYRGEKEQALEYLFKAMELAYPEKLVSYFIFNYNFLKDIIDEGIKIQSTTKTNIPRDYIESIKTALKKRKALKNEESTFDLSTRELDTLKLIAEDLTNQEIADKLFVSLNTVKTHLKNIFIKLEVSNRREAAAKAKEKRVV